MAGAIALAAQRAWCQSGLNEAPRPPAVLLPKQPAVSEVADTLPERPSAKSATEVAPAKKPAGLARPQAVPESRAEKEDPRDVKLRELESRLAETERRLRESDMKRIVSEAAEVPGKAVKKSEPAAAPAAFALDGVDEHEEAHVQIGDAETASADDGLLKPTAAADEDYKTDTERMEVLEERFRTLETKMQEGPKKETFPTFKITGFLQLDSAWYAQDHLNIATVGDAQDGTGFRRARLAVLGKVAPKTLYQLEVDFATAGRPSFFDNYVEQEDIPFFGAIRAGQYLQPFSVDAMSGFRNLPFLERSLPFLAFVPFRRVGIMASNNSEDELTYWAYSAFRTGGFNNAPLGDSQFATDIGDVGGYSFSTRVTHLLVFENDDHQIWHVGGAYNFSYLGADDAVGSGTAGNAGGGPHPFYQAKTTPEFGPLGQVQNSQSFGSAVNFTPTFVDTGKYAAHSFNLVGLETVLQNGPFSFQSEWMLTEVNSVVGPIVYHGAYAEAMYRVTGEHRPYDKKLAALRNVVPFNDFLSYGKEGGGVRGWGALELAARLSYVELRNPSDLSGHYYNSATNTFTGSAKTGAIGNGTLTDTTLGMTWFLNKHSKFQFDWIHAFLNNTAKGFSQADLFVTRVQVDF
jgi:phosphate-selective porin OprO/OprP